MIHFIIQQVPVCITGLDCIASYINQFNDTPPSFLVTLNDVSVSLYSLKTLCVSLESFKCLNGCPSVCL